MNYTAFIIPVDDEGRELTDSKGVSQAIQKDARINVRCEEQSSLCNDNLLFILPNLDFENYRVVINLHVDPLLVGLFDSVYFYLTTSNRNFSRFLIIFRSILLFISLVFGGVYLSFYARAAADTLTFEHHFILILSAALVFLNDPVYSLSVLYGYVPLVVLSTMYVAVFFSLVLLFNLVMYKRMHAEIDQAHTNLLTNLNISTASAAFMFLATLLIVLAVYSRFDPTVNIETQCPH